MTSLKSFVYDLKSSQDLADAIESLRRCEYTLPDQATRLGVPFIFRGKRYFRSIRPLQNPVEINQAYRVACDMAPKRVLEIGTAKGGTLYLWCQAAAPNATLVSVDLPGGKFGGGYVEQRSGLYQAFAQPDQKLHLLRANSHDMETFESVKELMGGEPVDFAFIDADHTYEGVRDDFLRYGTLVRPGGVVLFHDVVLAPHDPECQVHRLWDQIKSMFESQEFIGIDDLGRQLGIGMVRIGPDGFPSNLSLE